MPKKFLFVLTGLLLLLVGNSWLGLYSQNKTTEPVYASFALDSSLYEKMEVVHTTMKPAWYQFFAPTSALPTSLPADAPIAFVPKNDAQNPTLVQWTLVNQSKQALKLPTENGSLLMIQEAQDAKGKWRPVEYWAQQWGHMKMTAVKGEFILKPTQAIMVVAPKYEGSQQTNFRFKYKMIDKKGKTVLAYSPTFQGFISPTQFELSKEDKKKGASYLD